MASKTAVTDLGAHILKLLEKDEYDNDGFEAEFQLLEQSSADEHSKFSMQSALSEANKTKNRYSNVLPFEETRVKLAAADEVAGSDYINANWVDGLVPGSERQYISTQGPLPDTVEDFWRMVWETESNVIVMLTKEVESQRIKCSFYWPGGMLDEHPSSFVFQDFSVTLVEKESTNNSAFVKRTFTMEHSDGTKRQVVHYQYREWPDHGLPESAEVFRRMLHQVDDVRKENTPIIVHCSAGIGRSGTFCTVHSMIHQLTEHLNNKPDVPPSFNVMETILRARRFRGGMVQTKEQYVFCYKALLEEIQKLQIPNQTHVDSHSLHS